MMRSLGIFGALIVSLSLIACLVSSSPLMASTSPGHSTHFVSDKGPHLTQDETGCNECHADGRTQCGEDGPFFKSGTDGNGDGNYNLAETTVCDPCHSGSGP